MLERGLRVSAQKSGNRAATGAARTSAEAIRLGFGEPAERPGLEQVVHVVCCPYCGRRFDVLAAAWCGHQEGELSKICPSCWRCVCEHPAYAEPHFWKEAPAGFQRRGFRRLFLFYL